MTGEILGAVIIFLLTIVLAYPLGKFIAKVFKGEKNFMDFMNPWRGSFSESVALIQMKA